MVGPLFIQTGLNEIANLINKSGINCSYESVLTFDSFVTSTCTTHGNDAKTFFPMAQTLMMNKLDVHIGGYTVWVSHDKAEFQKIRENSHMIWLKKNSNFNISIH